MAGLVDRRDRKSRHDAAQDPVADLLGQDRDPVRGWTVAMSWTSASASATEQRHADAVIEPAFDVQPLTDPRREPRFGDDRLAERGVRRREHDRQDQRLLDAQPAERGHGDDGSQQDRQRQPDPEQPQRNRGAPQRPRSIREASAKSTSASVASASVRTGRRSG